MRKDRINSTRYYIAATLFFLSAIINFAGGNHNSTAVGCLCLGSTFLCLGSAKRGNAQLNQLKSCVNCQTNLNLTKGKSCMVKMLKQETLKQVRCCHCLSVLEYDYIEDLFCDDIRYDSSLKSSIYSWYINCPKCGHKIKVKESGNSYIRM